MRTEVFFGFLLFGLIASASLASSAWPLGKTETCEFFNTTSIEECDEVWCGIIDGNYNANLSACTFNGGLNESQMNLTGFYNKSEVDMILQNFSNSSNQTALIQELKSYADNQTLTLRDSVLDRIDNLSADISRRSFSSGSSSSGVEFPWYAWVLIVLVIGGVVVFLAMTSINKKQWPQAGPSIKPAYKRNQQQPVQQNGFYNQQPQGNGGPLAQGYNNYPQQGYQGPPVKPTRPQPQNQVQNKPQRSMDEVKKQFEPEEQYEEGGEQQ